jgi:phosphomannomutase
LDVLHLTEAVVRVQGAGEYAVAHDTRKTSQLLSRITQAALQWHGCDLRDCGLLPTPVFAFTVRHHRARTGFALTASHNPPDYVGVKLFGPDGMALPRDVELRLEEEALRRSARTATLYGRVDPDEPAIDRYLDALVARLPSAHRSLRILLDCGNGAGAVVAPELFTRLGHTVLTLNAHPSWRFTARAPEPTPESLRVTAELVRRSQVDLGIAQDGDADRVVLLHPDGSLLPDYLLSALVLKLLVAKRTGDVVISINTSRALEDLAAAHGCRAVRVRLGKTFEELQRREGVFATEPSKVVDPSWGPWEDGLMAAATIVQEMALRAVSLAELTRELPRYEYRQMNLEGTLTDRAALGQLVRSHFASPDVRGIDEIDGTRVSFVDGAWILFRVSGTEPKVRVYCEGRDQRRAQELLDAGVALVRTHFVPAAHR